MKFSGVWVIPLLFSFTGCSAVNLQASKLAAAPTAESTAPINLVSSTKPQPLMTVQTSPLASRPPAPQASPQTIAQTGSSEVQQDYAATVPLPSTGKVTIRDDIRNLDTQRLIATCPADSAPYAFAESTNYQVQICSQEFDPWLPKYYIGKAKDGSGEMRITSTNPNEARQLIFKHQGYTYILHRDRAHPETQNAYLQVFAPTGKAHAEALLYLYEMGRMPNG